ncbi:GrpB family protein [Gemella taiwanensis]
MDKRTIKIEEITNNKIFVEIFLEEVKKIQEIPKMPKCEFLHIGATSTKQVLGEKIVDILVVVENLHEITTFNEKRLNNIGYHRIAHNRTKGVIKYARITNYLTMSYDVVLNVVQRDTEIHKDFIKTKEIFNDEVLKNEYNSFKNSNKELSFKDYSTKKVIFINDMLKRIDNND